jgi:hypothetical protein
VPSVTDPHDEDTNRRLWLCQLRAVIVFVLVIVVVDIFGVIIAVVRVVTVAVVLARRGFSFGSTIAPKKPPPSLPLPATGNEPHELSGTPSGSGVRNRPSEPLSYVESKDLSYVESKDAVHTGLELLPLKRWRACAAG